MFDEQEILDNDATDYLQQRGNKSGTSLENRSSSRTQNGPVRGFKDFLLQPELVRAIMDCGFEQPSEGFI
jgi:superfamily II DNA/RNA helicase